MDAQIRLETGLGRLVVGDGLELLAALPPGSVDLLFADPPYNIGKAAWDSFPSPAAYLEWSARWLALAARALRPTGSLYLCGFSEGLADLKPLAARHFPSLRWLVWHYRNKANLGRDWGRSHESILHARGPDFRLDLDAVRVPYNRHTVRYPEHPQAESSQYGHQRHLWRPHPGGAKPRDVFEIPTLCNGMAEKVAHPTQKPLELVLRLVLAASAPGQLVVDPFAGAATTALACEQSGRRWLACEIDPAYGELGAARLQAPAAVKGGAERRRAQRARLR